MSTDTIVEVGGHLAAVTACLVEDAFSAWNRASAKSAATFTAWVTAAPTASAQAEAVYTLALETEEMTAERLDQMLVMAERVLPVY